MQFIDPYGDTVFNQLQIPVLIEEVEFGVRHISAEALKSHRDYGLRRAREANWAATIIKEHERAANASEFEIESELSRLREHIKKVLDVLSTAVKAGPHHYVRFKGD